MVVTAPAVAHVTRGAPPVGNFVAASAAHSAARMVDALLPLPAYEMFWIWKAVAAEVGNTSATEGAVFFPKVMATLAEVRGAAAAAEMRGGSWPPGAVVVSSSATAWPRAGVGA